MTSKVRGSLSLGFQNIKSASSIAKAIRQTKDEADENLCKNEKKHN